MVIWGDTMGDIETGGSEVDVWAGGLPGRRATRTIKVVNIITTGIHIRMDLLYTSGLEETGYGFNGILVYN